MARPEIPSIVVHNGSASAPGSPCMELPTRTLRPSRSLSKQTSLVDEEEVEESPLDEGEGYTFSPSASSPHPPSLPVTPPSPSPAVSPASPPTSTPTSAPGRPRSSTPSSTASSTNLAPSPSGPALPQGPGPGGGPFDGGTMAVGQGGPAGLSCLSSGATSRSKSLELPQQRSSDSEKDAPSIGSSRHRHYHHHHGSKPKLLQRSHAMQEDTSPPPDIMDPAGPMPPPHLLNSLTVCQPQLGCPGGAQRRRLRHQGSSQGSFDGSSPCLSRDSSTEYTDSTGIDLLQFIIQTLHKNQKDRLLLLKIERELVNIVKDPKRTYHKFPHMSSYQRMLVHRVAAYFGMEHNVDQVGTCVIVNKTRNTRLPETRFREHIRDELLPPDEPKRSILRRGFSSFEEGANYKSDSLHGIDSRRSKSFEEREEEYEKVRRRIFSEESFAMEGLDSPRRFHDSFMHNSRRNSHEDARWPDCRHFGDLESHRRPYDNHRIRPHRLAKGESFESHDSLHPRSLRPPVFKSHSFGGYSGGVTVLSRGDSVASNPSSRLSKQDSTGSRYSDHSSSSGYKTQRQDTSSTNVSNTLSTTPSPTAGQHHHPSFGQTSGVWGSEGESQPVMWAVTDMEAVPSGALLINPQSGQPYTNTDGSLYRFDPANPPTIYKSAVSSHHQRMSSMSSKDKEDKRMRGAPECVTPSTSSSVVPLSPPHGTSSGAITPTNPQSSSAPPVTCTSPGKGPPQGPPLETQDLKCDVADIDEGIEGMSGSGSSKSLEGGRQAAKHISRSCEEEPQIPSQTHYFHSSHIEGRSYSHENVSDVGSQIRQLNLSSDPPDVVSPVSVGTPLPPQGYFMPRQQYPPTVYYMPASSVQNISGGGIKYIYPQYQMAPVQAPANVQPTTLANLQTHPPPLPPLSNLPTIPQPIAGPGHPQPPNPLPDASAHLPAGYIPNNYAVMAYPPNGLLSSASTTGTGHESGGTTYYCQIAGPAAIAPATAAGTASNPGAASAPAVSLQQYVPSTTSTTTYPMPMGYYTGSGMGNNGLYQSPPLQGFPGGMYGAHHSHAGVTSQPPPQGALTYRAPTPPHTPSTQGVTAMPLGFSSAGSAGGPPSGPPPPPPAGVGGQYIAVLPPPQPPTPTSHASHASQLFPTFFRPSVQMMSGSAGTPPPQPVLQYGGGSAHPPTPHPPVFAKPYVSSSMHPLIAGGSGELPQGNCGGPSKEEKRFAGSVGSLPQSGGPMPPPVVPLTGTPTAHLIPRPSYTFMQNSMAGAAPGAFRTPTPILISGPRPRPFMPSPAGPLGPLALSRPPKFKRQKPRFSYSRGSSEGSNPQSFEGPEPTDKL